MTIQYYVPVQTQYQPQFLTAVIEAMIALAMLAVVGAFAFSQIRKAIRGEEVELPPSLGGIL